jgi:hypothetical protein
VKVVIGAGAALKMFFSFMFAALVKAPGEIARGLVHRERARAAAQLTKRLFGEGSAYVVAVGGVVVDTGAEAAANKEAQLDGLRASLVGVPGMASEPSGRRSSTTPWRCAQARRPWEPNRTRRRGTRGTSHGSRSHRRSRRRGTPRAARSPGCHEQVWTSTT